MATLAHNLNHAGVRHMVIAAEMGIAQIHQRVLTREMNVNPFCFYGDAKNEQWFKDKLDLAIKGDPGNIIYRDSQGLTFQQLRQIMVEGVLRHKVKGFILDYIQLVRGKEGQKSDAAHMDDVTQWIADFGRKHNVWNVVMAQINQEGNTRGGEGLRLACDQCYELRRPDTSKEGMWIEVMETRYTQWNNVGGEEEPTLMMHPHGPYIKEC